MSDSDDHESILNNLSKTRQLWSSKADLGSPNYLIPKSFSTTINSKKQVVVHNNDNSTPLDVVRPDDQEIENYDLPDIKAMKSQWEAPDGNAPLVPLPSAKSPATLAEEKSRRKKSAQPPPEPVNRVENPPSDDVYDVELNKLKAQFESAARAASKPRPKSPKTPMQNDVIKNQVSRNSTTKQAAGNTNKKLRFEDEMTSSNDKYVTEQRVESENLSVNLSGLKTQFESRKDENLVTPQLSYKKTPEKVGFDRIASASAKKQSSSQEDTSSHGDDESTALDEPVKSSEPVYDQMTGEESVKDRLKRFNSMTETPESHKPLAAKRSSQKRDLAPILKQDVKSESDKPAPDPDVVRSPPAGTRETPDYVGNVDLRQAKALFESPAPKPSQRSLSHSSSNLNSSPPPRTGRSSVSSSSRSSSRHSTASSRSKSPASNVASSNPESGEVNMADVVKPPPAGTKETPDYVPAVKVSSMKSMFESSDSSSSSTTPAPTPRRQASKESWVKSSEEEAVSTAKKEQSRKKVEIEVVRPPSAGTKEVPEYNLSSDFLKSRAAIFDAPAPREYTPRNKFNETQDNTPREIVNSQSDKADTDYELTQSLRDTKKMFESGTPVSPPRPPTKEQKAPVSPPAGDVVRPTPAGTREVDIVPASNLKSVKSLFEVDSKVVESSSRKKPIDIRSEAAEAQQREKQITAEKMTAPKQPEKEEAMEPVLVPQDVEESQPEPIVVPQEIEEPEPVVVLQEVDPEPEPAVEEPKADSSDSEVEEAKEAVVMVNNNDEEDEDGGSDSESESEGEYVVAKKDDPTQTTEEAAGVVPVRVAVSVPVNGEGDEAHVENKEVEEEDDQQLQVDVEQSSVKQTSNDDVTQEREGTSLLDDESFDKPHFHYKYDDDPTEKLGAPQASLLDLDPLNSPSGVLDMSVASSGVLDTFAVTSEEPNLNGGASLLDHLTPDFDLIPLSDPDRSENDLKHVDTLSVDSLNPKSDLGSDVTLNQSGNDLLNGFDDVTTSPSLQPTPKQSNPDLFEALNSSDPNPAPQADPFDLFSFAPAPAASPHKNEASNDPFDLFN